MAYIAPIHKPSSIRHAILVNLFDDEEESLVVAKTNRIEIYSLVEDQPLALRHSKVINGTITMIQKLRPKDSSTEILYIGTETSQYFTLFWNNDTKELQTAQNIEDVAEKYMRDSQSQDLCLVDPTGRFMAMHLWEGVMAVLRLLPRKGKTSELEWMDSVRISELFVKSSVFLYSETGHPKLAILYQSRADREDSKLATYRLTADDKDTQAGKFDPAKDREISLNIDDPGASLLIPVPKVEEEKRHNFRTSNSGKAFLGGLIVVGETRLTYIDDTTHVTVVSPLKESSIFVKWVARDERHYFLADDYGKMYLLTIFTEGVEVDRLEAHFIGTTSRAACLAYKNDMLFVGSHYGDSQLFKVDLEERPYLRLVQVLRNVAPVLDFAVMDMGNREGDSQLGSAYSSGQARIVMGSGVFKDGSLRSVRSGVGLEDIGILGDLEDVRGLFSLKSHGARKVDTLAVAFLTETRVFKFDPVGEVEEVESFEGLVFGEQTLLAADLDDGRRLQVTTSSAILTEKESGMVVTTWTPPGETITAASANSEWLLVSVDGKSIYSLSLGNGLKVSASTDFEDANQVACVHASPDLVNVGVVGFFTLGNVSIVSLDNLDPLWGESLRRSDDNSSIPRDLALVQTLPTDVGGPTLFVSVEDGTVVTFNVLTDSSGSTTSVSLSGRKSVILGTQQARFHLLPQSVDGLTNIFATTENPSLIYGSEGRIVYSSVTAEDATYICDFDTEAYPESVIVATEKMIKVSKIDAQRQTHVKPIHMGETVRRIAYSAKEQVFGLGCIKRELVRGEEIVTSSFKLVDEIIFDKIGQPFLLDPTELVESVIRATLPDSYGHPAERFLVGTSYMAEGDVAVQHDETRGRLLVLGVDSERNPYLLLSHKFKGSVRRVAVMQDELVVVALTKTVVVGRYDEKSSTEGVFNRLASYRPASCPVDISVQGNIIAVGDLMKSLSLVEYFPAQDGKPATLMEVARHYQSAWSTAVSHIEDQSWLVTDAQGNLIILRRNPSGPTLEDQRRMEMTSEMNLGEMVNCVRAVAVESSGASAMVHPKAFVGTVDGAVYLLGTVAAHAQDLLLRFQARVAGVVRTAGELSFERYRGFRNAERVAGEAGPFRFLDGELLERFLDMDEATQREVCRGLGPSVEDMRNNIEELKRMH